MAYQNHSDHSRTRPMEYQR